jgi:hypothetical protein
MRRALICRRQNFAFAYDKTKAQLMIRFAKHAFGFAEIMKWLHIDYQQKA